MKYKNHFKKKAKRICSLTVIAALLSTLIVLPIRAEEIGKSNPIAANNMEEESTGTEETLTPTPEATPTEAGSMVDDEGNAEEENASQGETNPEGEPLENPQDGVTGGVIVSFPDWKDEFKPIQTIEISKEDKKTVDDIEFPETISAILEDSQEYLQEEAVGENEIGHEVTEIPVTWEIANGDDYEKTDFDTYTFYPVLPTEYTLAKDASEEEIKLPYLDVKVGQVNPNTKAATTEGDWIAAAVAWITGSHTTDAPWDTYMGEQYLKEVSGNGSTWNHLSWRTPTDGIPAWDGTEASTANTSNSQTDPQSNENADMIPYYDSATQTYEVWSAAQLLYAFRRIKDNGVANDPKGYTVHIMRDIDFNGKNGFLWPVDVVLPSNVMVTLDGMKADKTEANLFNLYMWRNIVGSNGKIMAGPTALIQSSNAFFAKDLNFRGANIQGSGNLGEGTPYQGAAVLLGTKDNYTGTVSIETGFRNISFEDTVVVGRASYSSVLVGRDQGNYGVAEYDTHKIENCSSVRGSIIGAYHTGGLMGSVNSTLLIDRCYAVETTVVTYGGHSGGLIACGGDTGCVVTNCFVDASVYGLKNCGVFSGALGGSPSTVFVNCYSSGFVEGNENLGGFMGVQGGTQNYYLNCYSTALVGLNSDGKNLGGFIGNSSVGSVVLTMGNCYAAGEVGSANTYVKSGDNTWPNNAHPTSDTNSSPDYVGGFIGATRGNNNTYVYLWNCFYDKQTTAMREWITGSANNSSIEQTKYSTSNETTFFPRVGCEGAGQVGLRGVLTTTADKLPTNTSTTPVTYTGLTNAPNSTEGFSGFVENKDSFNELYKANQIKFKPSDYTYYGWNQTNDGHYPQLSVFQEAGTNGRWDEDDQALVAAYSSSSTATVELETWNTGLKADTGDAKGEPLPLTTYDTTRDITSRFNLTDQSGEIWKQTATQDGTPGTKATVTIQGVTKDVLELLQDKRLYADKFAPGMEWLEVETTVSGYTATRRLRVTPTVGLNAGESANIYETDGNATSVYDHADDVEFYYTTADRWAVSRDDITTGIYPDTSPNGTTFPSETGVTRNPNAITTNQTKFANGAENILLDNYFGSNSEVGGTDTNDHYGVILNQDKTKSYPGVDMSYMSRNSTDPINGSYQDNTAKDSKVYTYIRPIMGFDASDNNRIKTGPIIDMTIEKNMDCFNGYRAFDSMNSQFLVEYVWELHDGRLIRDAKIITVKNTPFTINIDAYESGGIAASTKAAFHDTDDSLVQAQVVNKDADINDITYNGIATNSTVKAQTGEKVVTAWRLTNHLKQVNKIKVDFIFKSQYVDEQGETQDGDVQHYYTTLANPKVGDKVVVPYEFWRIVTLADGEYYSIPFKVERTYEIGQKIQSDGTIYQYLFFDLNTTYNAEDGTKIQVLDMEDNLQVDVELSEALMLQKTVEGKYANRTLSFDFDIYYSDAATQGDNAKEEGGTYTYLLWDNNGTPDNIKDDTQVKDSNGNAISGTITAKGMNEKANDKPISLKANQYMSIVGGRAGDQYKFEENDYSTIHFTTSVEGAIGSFKKTVENSNNTTWESPETGKLTIPQPDSSTSSVRSTGTQTLPLLSGETNDYSRVIFKNKLTEVVPTDVDMGYDYTYLMLGVAGVFIGISVLYCHNRRKKRRFRSR